MAAPSRREDLAVAEQLQREPYRFEFFQAVWLLDQMRRESGQAADLPPEPLIGQDLSPIEEPVHFRSSVSASFPANAVHAIAVPPAEDGTRPVQMTVNFMGLTGPVGVLPQHVTMQLIQLQRANDHRLAAFQELFDHRLISLFYRAWEKYRVSVMYERCRRASRSIDHETFTRCVLSLCGFGYPSLLERQAFRDEGLAFYSGHLAHHPRNAVGLSALLSDVLDARVVVEQFVGRWYAIEPEEVSRLPSRTARGPAFARLGTDLTLGERVFLVDRLFRLVIGPLTLAQYESLLPIGGWFAAVQDWIRTYAGAEFDATIHLTLRADHVPPCRVGKGGSRLAWTSFVGSRPFTRDARGATFACAERR
jgi:type VI secretion system protein ImpH